MTSNLLISVKTIKASKKIVKQFMIARYEQLIDCNVLGYVVGLYDTNKRTIILESKGSYYRISLEFENKKTYVGYCNGPGKGETILRVNNVDEWFDAYQDVSTRAIESGQLFL